MTLKISKAISVQGSEYKPTGLRDITPPEVEIFIPSLSGRQLSYIVTFRFTKPVYGFGDTSINRDNVAVSNIQGAGRIWTCNITLDSNSKSDAYIEVAANSVTDEEANTGPTESVRLDFSYDTTAAAFSPPSGNTRSQVNNFTAGFAWEGVLEMVAYDGDIYAVVQKAKYEHPLEQVIPGVAPLYTTKAITKQVQAGAVLRKCDLSTGTWSDIKEYDNVTLAARSLKVIDDKIYFIEGSHYAYYNEGFAREIRDPDQQQTVDMGTFAYGTYGITAPFLPVNEWTIISVTKLYLVIDKERADFDAIRDALKVNSDLYVTDTTVKITGVQIAPPVSDGRVGITIDFRVTDEQGSPIRPNVFKRFIVRVGETHQVFHKSRFRGVSDNWKSQIGQVRYIDTADDTVKDVGRAWAASDIASNPYLNSQLPHDVEEYSDNLYGIAGGTASPLLYDGERIHTIVGHGKLDLIDDNENEVSRLENWQWLQYHTNLNRRVVEVETNGRTTLQVMEDIATITNSIIFFDGERFLMKPRPVGSVMPTHTIDLNADTLQQPISSVRIENDLQQLFNKISVRYGLNKTYSTPLDEASAAAYGDRELVLNTSLDDTQIVWIRQLAGVLLQQFSRLRQVITMRLSATVYLKLADVVQIVCEERARLNTTALVIDIQQDFVRRNNNFQLQTVVKFATL